MGSKRRWNKTRYKWLLVIVSGGVALGVAECALRVLSPPVISGVGTLSTPKAAHYGWAPPPNKTLPFVNPDTGEVTFFRTNREGWKDVDHDRVAQPSTVRILLVGDSNTYGVCGLDDTIGRQLQKELPAHYEVISIGVGSWGTDQSLEALRREGLQWAPNIVLYQFCANDITDNIQPSETYNFDPIHHHKPFQYFVESGELVRRPRVPRPVPPKPWRKRLRDHAKKSALAYHSVRTIRRLVARAEPSPQARSVVPLKRELAPEDSDAAWQLFRLLLVEMKTEVSSANAKFVVFPVAPQGIDSLSKACGSVDVPLMVPSRTYEAYENDRHLTAKGNRQLVADLMAYLQKLGLISKKTD